MSEGLDAPVNGESVTVATRQLRDMRSAGRSFSALMRREAAIRGSMRSAGPLDHGAHVGGVYLAPEMRRALAALLRGDYVAPNEKKLLANAASLLPTPNAAGEALRKLSPPKPQVPSIDCGKAANANEPLIDRIARGLAPPVPVEAGQRLVDDGAGCENPVLRGLGLHSDRGLPE